MRILFFGSGSPASVAALEGLLPRAAVAGVVVPGRRRSFLPRRNPAAPLLRLAEEHRLRIFQLTSHHKLGHELQRAAVQPELICIATFPSILRRETLALAPRGAINVHSSLLPRHRGPDPLFWTYLCDDRVTGVTVHWVDEGADTGDILIQRAVPLARGRFIIDLYHELSRLGAELLAEAVRLIEGGNAPRLPQKESEATREPARGESLCAVDAKHWPAERVWHVLRGVTIGHAALLSGPDGRRIRHGPASQFTVAPHTRPPGTVEVTAGGLRVFCYDGFVDVQPAKTNAR